ncbi:DNA methyltransferase [Streptomyces sp. IBSBF 3010]|uniref:DNA methyltransferase n=1 Tax=Streptomyces sp. IBSBF 3010 TaxID=2903526 RepID=UPI003FA6B9C6
MTRWIDAGWSDCGHGNWRRGMVLDPFSGSGTTGVAAAGAQVDYLGLDLDSRNHAIARERRAMLGTCGSPRERTRRAYLPSDPVPVTE